MKKHNIIILLLVTGFVVSVGCFFFKSNTYHVQISIALSKYNTPIIMTNIQGRDYELEYDTGSKFQCKLSDAVLSQLTKTQENPVNLKDMFGESYSVNTYNVSGIRIEQMSFDNITIASESEEYKTNTTFLDELLPISHDTIKGSIGNTLFGKWNILYDYPNNRMFVSNDIQKLEEAGYCLNEFEKIKFHTSRNDYVIVECNTDFGEARLLLDTGTTACALRSSFVTISPSWERHGIPVITSSKCQIGSKDFGSEDFLLFDITSELSELDGIIGTEFLLRHTIYIDHANNIMYVK